VREDTYNLITKIVANIYKKFLQIEKEKTTQQKKCTNTRMSNSEKEESQKNNNHRKDASCGLLSFPNKARCLWEAVFSMGPQQIL
jgi:hypothetical protein